MNRSDCGFYSRVTDRCHSPAKCLCGVKYLVSQEATEHVEPPLASPVNPAHYKQGTIECYDAIASMLSQEELRGYLRGNSLKYRWRYRQKGGVTDLEKAGWYEAKLLEMERGK